jgi:hypothetical protein
VKGTLKMRRQRRFNTGAYLAAQAKEVLGPLHRYYTGLAVGRDPTAEDCWRHWCASRASDAFCAAHQQRFWIWSEASEDEHAD